MPDAWLQYASIYWVWYWQYGNILHIDTQISQQIWSLTESAQIFLPQTSLPKRWSLGKYNKYFIHVLLVKNYKISKLCPFSMLSWLVRIQSIFSWTDLVTLITLVTMSGLHVLGLNMVGDVVALSRLVVANQTQEGVWRQLLHVFLQTTLDFIIVCTTYIKDIKNKICYSSFKFVSIYYLQ